MLGWTPFIVSSIRYRKSTVLDIVPKRKFKCGSTQLISAATVNDSPSHTRDLDTHLVHCSPQRFCGSIFVGRFSAISGFSSYALLLAVANSWVRFMNMPYV